MLDSTLPELLNYNRQSKGADPNNNSIRVKAAVHPVPNRLWLGVPSQADEDFSMLDNLQGGNGYLVRNQ
jgi:hypothetical protein